ncbi:putative 1-aminocyclopropane-1-carboxylate synthase [Wilcoxina mikolae CBS 423.85]|nr:putative 1-aminocyclopropane-1-carboxylate synthase [Wilcoxina mikolae CBS 423.85]
MPLIEEIPVLSARGSEAWNEWRKSNPDFEERTGKRWWTPDGVKPPRSNDVIDLSVAENTLMFDELRTQIKAKFPETLVDADFTYGEGPGGSSRLRGYLKDFINSYFNIPSTQLIDKEHIVTTPGVYSAMEQISWVVANPGDGILVGRPYYGGFIQGFAKGRSKVKIVGVEFKDIDPFSIEAVKVYRNALERSNEDGTPITAILLCNPNNPLGRCFPREVLEEYINLCTEKNIHLIADEIYALSHFRNDNMKEQVPFTSLLATPVDEKTKSRIHVLYGMSKDFGSSGVRLGAIISRSSAVINAVLTGASYLSWVSSGADIMWSCILCDKAFVRRFVEKNQAKLGRCYKIVTGELQRHGIGFNTQGNAGVFVWVDLRYALGDADTERESEDALTERLIDGWVKLSPGRKFRTEEVGWYRLTFARPEEDLRIAVERIVAAVGTPAAPRQRSLGTFYVS